MEHDAGKKVVIGFYYCRTCTPDISHVVPLAIQAPVVQPTLADLDQNKQDLNKFVRDNLFINAELYLNYIEEPLCEARKLREIMEFITSEA